MSGGSSRRLALVVALGAVVAVGGAAARAQPSPHAGQAQLRVPALDDSCIIPSFAFAHYATSGGHAVSGTWTLQPRISCDAPKTAVTITVTLRRNGQAQLSSSGVCRAHGKALCTSATGPRRTKSYATTIRAAWNASVVYSVTGPDAALFGRSSPSAGTCVYRPLKLMATCRYDTAPVVIR
ncbi:MAG: hypothetical protein ACJ735_06575 [Actinomycetes bacterium]